MNNRFELLDEADVVNLLAEGLVYPVLQGQDTFRVDKMSFHMACRVIGARPADYNDDCYSKLREWFEPIDAQVLKVGSSSWQKGKVRIKTSIEFCPDDYDSPLAEIRSQES